jgi:AraC-like DNA-binding protein
MKIEIYDLARIVAGFQFLLISIFLITHKNGRRISHKILAVFLLSKALVIIEHTLLLFKAYLIDFPHMFCILRSSVFLFGPSLYFYTKSIAFRNFKFKKEHVIHLIPFLAYCVFFIFKFHIQSTEIKQQLILQRYIYAYSEALIIFSFLNLQVLVYIVASLIVLKNYRFELKKAYSSVERINLSWLHFILFGYIVIWSIDLLDFIILMASGSTVTVLNIITLTLIFIFANVIVYKGLKQPEIYAGIEDKPKYESSPLTEADIEQYVKKMTVYMKSEKPYLDPSLNITNLAKKLSIPSRHLSQVINQSLHKNFFDFVNSYRIEEAKRYLADHSNNRKTVLEILYEVGFNSKSSFNNVFKKHTGMTPTEFKRLNSKNN